MIDHMTSADRMNALDCGMRRSDYRALGIVLARMSAVAGVVMAAFYAAI